MLYHHLFKDFKKADSVNAAIIGAGHFGTAVVTQQKYVSDLRVSIVADKNLESAKNAYIKAEIPESDLVYANTSADAEAAIVAGKYVYTDAPDIICTTPSINILVEGTGVPEASAKFCVDAIKNKKHVALISKETDSVIGPQLKKLAKENSVVYTMVDGDQPALMIAMVEWAREIGLTVISAGKSRDGEFILDEENKTVSIVADGITVHDDYVVHLKDEDMKYFKMIPEGKVQEYIDKRTELLSELPNAGAFDLCELTMMANACNLHPYIAPLTQGTLRITELPVAYCSTKNGGIYENKEGIIDVHTCLRRSDEAGMGGGVFMVVRCDNAYSNYILTTKGQIPNYDLSTAVIYRPYHLCGVEVTTSLKSAVMLGIDTSSREYVQHYDLVKIATCDIKAGEVFGNDHDLHLVANIVPAGKRGADVPIPGHMLDGNKAKVDIKSGQVITYNMVETPENSVLWAVRADMEKDM